MNKNILGLVLAIFLISNNQSIAIDKFAIVTPSFQRDANLFPRMYKSFKKHLKSSERVKFYLIVPERDVDLFKGVIDQQIDKNLESNKDIVIIKEPDLIKQCGGQNMLKKFDQMVKWRKQQILKLCFYKTGFAENYMTIDSDVYLFRDLPLDHLFHGNTLKTYEPYFMNHNNGFVSKFYGPRKERYYDYINNKPRTIFENVATIKHVLKDKSPDYNHFVSGTQLWNKDILSDMEKFLTKENYDFIDIIQMSPWEIGWYITYLRTYHMDKFFPIHNIFIMTNPKSCYYGDLFTEYYGVEQQYQVNGLEFKVCPIITPIVNATRTLAHYIRSLIGILRY